MSRSERWNTSLEIKRRFYDTLSPACSAGPVVYIENGRMYSDDSESHIAVIGRTGKGKSQCCSLPYMRQILRKGESLIMLDPKGEGNKKNACYIPENYQKFCIDFRNPRQSPTKWNPLSMIYQLYCSNDPDDHDKASEMINELYRGVYPIEDHAEAFWPDAAAEYTTGLTYGLFEIADKETINLDSVSVMVEQSENRPGFLGNTTLKDFYEQLPTESLAKRHLATYASAPNDTRGSIRAVAASGLGIFSRSKGLMEMLSEDTLNIMDIDVTRPFVLTVITPDETEVYSKLSGLLISQFTQHLIRIAQKMDGRLPIRVNIILEELGSVGKSIPSLPDLMAAGRSRNIRLMLVLQSITQLKDVYGESKAEAINSCIGITIGFSTNNWDTLTEWSHRCGERQYETYGSIIREPLITAAQLAAMPTGTALVMVDSQYKFIAHFPLYDEMYDNSGWKAPKYPSVASKQEHKAFDFEAMVKDLVKKQDETKLSNVTSQNEIPDLPFGLPFSELPPMDELLDDDPAPKVPRMKYHVIITGINSNRFRIARLIAAATGVPLEKAMRKIIQLPADIAFRSRKDAERLAKAVSKAGAKARIETS